MQVPEDIGRPVYVPENRRELPRLVEACAGWGRPAIVAACEALLDEPTPDAFLRFEQEVLGQAMGMASHVVAGVLAYLHEDPAWVSRVVAQAREKAGQRLRHQGVRRTPVRFLGGARLWIDTPYLSDDLRGRPGRRRGRGRRGPTGTGCYPVLEALGIRHQATPALASEVARQSVRVGSFEEAHQALGERGIPLDEKTVWKLTRELGEEALREREARIRAAAAGVVLSDELAGRRIVVSADGGRVRMREGGRRGRRGKKGRRRFRTPWREPKLVIAYAIDAEGRRDPERLPLYDATMGDADAAFRILIAELKLRGAAKAELIVLTGDGALWIWNRADKLARALGLGPEQIVCVADFYHAVEHLTEIAELCAGWSEAERKHWVRGMRRKLKAGKVKDVIAAARALCRGRNGGKIGTEVRYFEERSDKMRYDRFREQGIPLGSGAVESAIRRVVNLRMKGPSIFWRAENAEGMLHLRCYLKAGRWDELLRRVITQSGRQTANTEGLEDAA